MHWDPRIRDDWVKLYAATRTRTNVVTAARVTMGMGARAGDSSYFKDLVNTTAQRFLMREVSADKAYLAKEHLETVAAVGAMPFVPFSTGDGCEPTSTSRRRSFSRSITGATTSSRRSAQ